MTGIVNPDYMQSVANFAIDSVRRDPFANRTRSMIRKGKEPGLARLIAMAVEAKKMQEQAKDKP